MSGITNNQNKPIVIGSPIEIESAVNDIRLELSNIPWVSHPYFIAQRFTRQKGSKTFVYPETYCTVPSDPSGKYEYHRLTADNDYSGMFFAIIGTGANDFSPNEYNYLTYPVSLIFSVNLELIDNVKLANGLFTRELIRDARRVLTDTMVNHEFEYVIKKEITDLKEVYKEFSLDDLEQYNRAPLQCFRFDLEITIKEVCI